MKYSLLFFLSVLSNWSVLSNLADSQFGLSYLCNICPNGQNELIPISDFGHFSLVRIRTKSVQMVEMGRFPNRISDTFIQSEFGLNSPNCLSNEIARKNKAIEIRSEIICTMLGC